MQKIIIIALVICAVVTIGQSAKAQSQKKVKYKYLTFLPENYDSLKGEQYPVIFYLHGRSVSGTDINRIKRYGLPFFLSRGKKINYIVIAPQCPWGKNWASEDWFDPIFSEVCTKYRVDTSRVYLTGMSLGGFGTWELADRYPHTFAAIAPLCGGAETDWAETLSHIPVWVFHGAKDRQVPVSRSDKMVKALKDHHGLVVYSRLPDKGHDIHRVYDDDRLYAWFSQFSLRPKKGEEDYLKPMQGIQVAWLGNASVIKEPLQRIIH